jgi:hypothetical protein
MLVHNDGTLKHTRIPTAIETIKIFSVPYFLLSIVPKL